MLAQVVRKRSILSLAKRLSSSSSSGDSLGPNDVVAPTIKNRNPFNLEKMRIGYKPSGFAGDKGCRSYWNGLKLSIGKQPPNVTAEVVHWTGRTLCKASTEEWAIEKFLYNNADLAALKIVGKVLGQRCLETGISNVTVLIEAEELKREKVQTFLEALSDTGLTLHEEEQYLPYNPHYGLINNLPKSKIKPWEIIDE